MKFVETLLCNVNIDDNITIKNGRISFCMIHNSVHFFILVESGKYSNKVWIPDTRLKTMAFSYVPENTYMYIQNKYTVNDFKYINDPNTPLSTYIGYILFVFTKSYVVDTWKLTDKFIRLKSKPVKNWQYNRFAQFDKYNIASLIPYFGITDCIGYSNYQYNLAKDI